MMEQAHAGEGHHHIVLIALSDDQIIADGAAGLGDVGNTAGVGTLNVIRKGEESVGKGAVSLGIATDLGIADAAVRNALAGCNMLVFESNYDSAMLDASSRPLHTKRRIRSFKGHMGNDDAMQELPDLIGEETQMITLVHVSRECNDYSLVDSMARNMLSAIHREDIYLDVARQDDICRPFCFCRS